MLGFSVLFGPFLSGGWCSRAQSMHVQTQVQNHVFISSACFRAFITCKFVFTNDKRTAQAKLNEPQTKCGFSLLEVQQSVRKSQHTHNTTRRYTQRALQHNDFIESVSLIISLLYKIRLPTPVVGMQNSRRLNDD